MLQKINHKIEKRKTIKIFLFKPQYNNHESTSLLQLTKRIVPMQNPLAQHPPRSLVIVPIRQNIPFGIPLQQLRQTLLPEQRIIIAHPQRILTVARRLQLQRVGMRRAVRRLRPLGVAGREGEGRGRVFRGSGGGGAVEGGRGHAL